MPLSIALLPLSFSAWDGIRTRELSQEQLESEYVQIALNVLTSTPSQAETQAQEKGDQALRSWSVDVLTTTSPVPLTEDLRAGLRQGETSLTGSQTMADFAESTVEDLYVSRLTIAAADPDWTSYTEEERNGRLSEFLETRRLLSQERRDWSQLPLEEQNRIVTRDMGIPARP